MIGRKYFATRIRTYIFIAVVLFPMLACSLIQIELFAGCRQAESISQKANRKVEATLALDHLCYIGKEPVGLHLSLENISDETVTIQREGGGSIISLSIHGEKIDQHYSWEESSGAMQSLTSLDLEPGETYEIDWSVLPSGEGYFTARAIVYQDNYELVNIDITFEINNEGT